MLVFVAGCGGGNPQQKTNPQSERYADFSYSAIAHYIYTSGVPTPVNKTRISFTFTPSKLGTFLIIAGTTQEKVVLTDGDFKESIFEFPPVDTINVFWSDGIEIERTEISVKYEE